MEQLIKDLQSLSDVKCTLRKYTFNALSLRFLCLLRFFSLLSTLSRFRGWLFCIDESHKAGKRHIKVIFHQKKFFYLKKIIYY